MNLVLSVCTTNCHLNYIPLHTDVHMKLNPINMTTNLHNTSLQVSIVPRSKHSPFHLLNPTSSYGIVKSFLFVASSTQVTKGLCGPDRLCCPPSLLVTGHLGSFRGAKEAEACADVRNTWSYTSTPLYVLAA
jgi:hypothetical protein